MDYTEFSVKLMEIPAKSMWKFQSASIFPSLNFQCSHNETQSFINLVHTKLKIFVRSVKAIPLNYKQQKNGFSLVKGTECVSFLVSVSLMIVWNMLR